MCETSNPGPIKKSTSKQSFQLIQGALQVVLIWTHIKIKPSFGMH